MCENQEPWPKRQEIVLWQVISSRLFNLLKTKNEYYIFDQKSDDIILPSIHVNPHEEIIIDVLNVASHFQQTHTDAHHLCSQISECESEN